MKDRCENCVDTGILKAELVHNAEGKRVIIDVCPDHYDTAAFNKNVASIELPMTFRFNGEEVLST